MSTHVASRYARDLLQHYALDAPPEGADGLRAPVCTSLTSLIHGDGRNLHAGGGRRGAGRHDVHADEPRAGGGVDGVAHGVAHNHVAHARHLPQHVHAGGVLYLRRARHARVPLLGAVWVPRHHVAGAGPARRARSCGFCRRGGAALRTLRAQLRQLDGARARHPTRVVLTRVSCSHSTRARC